MTRHPAPTVRFEVNEDSRDPTIGAVIELAEKPTDAALEACGALWAAFVFERSSESSCELCGARMRLSMLPSPDDGGASERLAAFVSSELHGACPIVSAVILVSEQPQLEGTFAAHPAFERGFAAWRPPSPVLPPPAASGVVDAALAIANKVKSRETREWLTGLLAAFSQPDPEARKLALEELIAELKYDQFKVMCSLVEVIARDDPDEGVRAHAILLLGDEDADEGRGTRVPVEIWSRVLTCGLADPAARVRETAALVSNELQVSKAARAKLPPHPWAKDKKKVSEWPLVWISGFWHPAEPPKVLPPWVLEEVVRRLRQPYHRHAAAGVHFLRSIDKSIDKPLPSVVVEALFERARRTRPSPGAVKLLVHVMGLTDETRPLLDAGLHSKDVSQRRDAVDALLSASSAEERLAFIAEHTNDLAIRSEIVQHLLRRVDAASWEACRPLLEALAIHPDPKIAGAAKDCISSTQKHSL